ncbi:C-C chemokine receptor type 10 [Limanda limanda]|uniref:C-C chemokine receptor type 10 n=1 Tax=Limanda limanda TaxID=27771 RepID=UPI0029C68836|nr:C-C chemokine receptor type 10 [Limanda limanda]
MVDGGGEPGRPECDLRCRLRAEREQFIRYRRRLQDMRDTSNSSGMDYYYDDGFLNDSFLNSSDNSSNYDDSFFCDADESTIKMFQTCFFCLIFLLGMLGNCLVIATFALYRRLRLRSLTDVFLLHLALADLLLLLTLPLQAVDTHRGWIFSVSLCKATRACYAVNTYSGLLLLACISVDRYLVVARAQDVLRLRSRILRGGKMAALGVWVVAVLLSLPEILFSDVTELGPEDSVPFYCGILTSGKVKMAANGAIIGVFCVSLLVMVACYSVIACVLWEGNRLRRGKQWQRQRTLKLMVALVLVFLLFQLPYTVVLSQKIAAPECGLHLPEYVTCTLAYARCCLNPVLYALVGVRFRGDVLRLLRDSGCLRGLYVAPQALTSTSPSSPALTAPSVSSPTPHERFSSNEIPSKFLFPGNK